VGVLDVIRSALLDAVALVLPTECVGCGRDDRMLCVACAGILAPKVELRDVVDGIPAYTALRYEGIVRSVVLAFKEDGRVSLARSLAPAFAAALAAGPRDVEVLPVPGSMGAMRRRGFDPVIELARAARCRPALELRIRSTRKQKTLGIEERAENRVGAISARRSLAGRRFVLIDDVVTSGATVREAVRAVHAAGGEVVWVAAVAFTPRYSADPKPVHVSSESIL
jgi:predicted amidophosphoribosyltransferase